MFGRSSFILLPISIKTQILLTFDLSTFVLPGLPRSHWQLMNTSHYTITINHKSRPHFCRTIAMWQSESRTSTSTGTWKRTHGCTHALKREVGSLPLSVDFKTLDTIHEQFLLRPLFKDRQRCWLFYKAANLIPDFRTFTGSSKTKYFSVYVRFSLKVVYPLPTWGMITRELVLPFLLWRHLGSQADKRWKVCLAFICDCRRVYKIK